VGGGAGMGGGTRRQAWSLVAGRLGHCRRGFKVLKVFQNAALQSRRLLQVVCNTLPPFPYLRPNLRRPPITQKGERGRGRGGGGTNTETEALRLPKKRDAKAAHQGALATHQRQARQRSTRDTIRPAFWLGAGRSAVAGLLHADPDLIHYLLKNSRRSGWQFEQQHPLRRVWFRSLKRTDLMGISWIPWLCLCAAMSKSSRHPYRVPTGPPAPGPASLHHLPPTSVSCGRTTRTRSLAVGGAIAVHQEGQVNVSHATMQKADMSVARRGATSTNFGIHTPTCASSRSELQSGRYFHNTANNAQQKAQQ
jgi:hypothetical protein